MSTGLKQPLTLERIQRLADELRAAYEELVGGETIAAPALIREAVAEWSTDILPVIDARIIRCHELIRRGLRDEAIGHAIESPDLFEAVKFLDLERFGRAAYASWMEASRAAGLVAPPPPQLDKMADIEAARDRLADLRPLLDRWRRMNFQRASLTSRIQLLREIVSRDADPQSHVWQTMLDEHEARRLMEIKADLARMREQISWERDVDVERIEREVCQFVEELDGDWETLEPPIELSDQARRLIVEARRRRIDATLDGLVPQLEAAHAAMATDRAAAKEKLQRLLDTWKRALAERGVIDPGDPRLARVGAITGYAELLREHEALVAEVGHRVAERPATLRSRIAWADELDRMMDRVDDSATHLPAQDVDPRRISELSHRVADITDTVRREQRLRQFFALSVVAVLIVGVTATAWSVYALNHHRAAVNEAIAACDAALEKIVKGEEIGEDLGSDWAPPVRREPRVTASLERVKAAERKRIGGREAFARRVDDMRTALAELQAAPRPDPLAPWPESFAHATKILADLRAPGMAISDDDLAKLEQPAAMLRTKSKDYTAAADDAFEDRVRRLEADLATVAVVLADDPARAEGKLDEAAVELAKLRAVAATAACPSAAENYGGRKLISESVAVIVAADSKAANTLNGLRSRREIVAGLAARERVADQLLMNGKYAEYADAIRKIADDLGSGPVARDYNDAARNHAAWQAISEWRRFSESLVEPASLTATKTKKLLEERRSLGPEVTRLRDAKEVISWLEPFLERAVVSTAESLDQLRATFIKILESQHGEGIDGVVWEKGVLPYPRYYCLLKDRPLPGQKRSIKYVTGRPDAQKNWPQKSLSFDPNVHDVADSPQKLLALACKKVVQTIPHDVAAVDRLAAGAVRACATPPKTSAEGPSLDPCLQAILLRFLVAKACEASPIMRASLPGSLAALDTGNDSRGQQLMIKGVDNEAFTAVLDPVSQDDAAWIRANRDRCATFVKLVAQEVEGAVRKIEDREQDVARRYRDMRNHRCVGRLRKLSEGGWAISGGDPAARAGKPLFIAGGPQDEYRMVPCVDCDAKGGIPAGSHVKGRAGEPVFIEIASGKKG